MKNIERKKKEVMNRRKPSLKPTIQLVTVNLYNKFLSHDTHSLCYSVFLIRVYGDILDEKCGEKEGSNTWKNIPEKAGSQSHNATSHCQFTYKILTFYLELLLRNLLYCCCVVVLRPL